MSSPTSLLWTRKSGQGWINFGANVSLDNTVSYGAFYVVNPTGKPQSVRVGTASDDAEQILIDGKEVWIHNVARGSGSANIQDHSPLFDLAPGKHLVLAKIFEG